MADTLQIGPLLTNALGDQYYYSVNGPTFANVSATSLFDSQYKERVLAEDQLSIVVGADSGLLVTYLRHVGLPKGCRVVIVELSEVFHQLVADGKLEELPENLFVTTADDLWQVLASCNFEVYSYLGKIKVVEAFCAIDGYLFAYRELAFKVASEVRQQEIENQASTGTQIFVDTHFQNLADLRVDARRLKGQFKNRTAVLLGGGPSLDELLPWVKENQNRVVIFAVSRICRQLAAAGIVPHIIVSADPYEENLKVSHEMFAFADRSLLVHANHLFPALLGQWAGRSMYLGAHLPWDKERTSENIPIIGPTVTNVAFELIDQMAFSQVIFGGVDYCFSQLGVTHASGSNESSVGTFVGGGHNVETYAGGMAETRPDYYCSFNVMCDQVQAATLRGCAIFNPSPGAAKMPSVQHSKLAELKIDLCHENPEHYLQGLLPSDDRAARLTYYRHIVEELSVAKSQLRKFHQLAKKGLKYNDALFGRNGRPADYKFKTKMDRLEKRLQAEFADFYFFVKSYGIRQLLKLTRPDSLDSCTDEELETLGRAYYESCLESSTKLLKNIESTIVTTQMRMREEDEFSDVSILAAHWRKLSQPRRYLVWRERAVAPLQSFSDDVEQLFCALENEYQDLVEKLREHHKQCLQQAMTLDGVKGHIANCYKLEDKAGLLRIVGKLENHAERELAEKLTKYAMGLLAELEGDGVGAITSYQSLIGDEVDDLTVDALSRIASVSLSLADPEMALNALECLANLSDYFKPKYANLLRLVGKTSDALDVYADYLEKMPDDYAVMIDLGRLYQALNQIEGARMMYRHVLENDTDNHLAEQLLHGLG